VDRLDGDPRRARHGEANRARILKGQS
jgi:hypothetical protein